MLRVLPRSGATRHGWTGSRALAAYVAVSFLYFGLRLFLYPSQAYVGFSTDPQIFIWAFAWWPHAILHGLNPFYTRAIWAPSGVNLTWTTSTPGLAVAFAPLTLLVGPLASFDVAAVLMPALAAWTAFLLCRHITRAAWPSLAGGYLFGFSSYMLGQEAGHLHMTSIFLVPLAALAVLRYVERELDGRGLVKRLGPLLAAQLTFSTEIAFTLTLALAAAVALGLALAPAVRARLVSLLAPLACAYLVAAALTAPFLYFLVTGFQGKAFQPPEGYTADLLNFFVPTHLEASGAWWAHLLSRSFPGNDGERGAFFGPAVLVILVLFARRQLATARGRVLLSLLGVGVLAALGSALHVDGHRIVALPWGLVGSLPVFDNTLPVRLTLYVSLVVAVIVAIWAASPGRARWLRVVLPVLAILAIVPNPVAHVWETSISVPPFFTSSSYRYCLQPGEIVLPLPVSASGDENTWQAESGFRFRMAGGYIGAIQPPAFTHPADVQIIASSEIPPEQPSVVEQYVEIEHVTTILLDENDDWLWRPLLDQITTPEEIGGVLVYRVGPRLPRLGCPS